MGIRKESIRLEKAGMKICKKCGETKNLSAFSFDIRRNKNVSPCVVCKRAYDVEHGKANRKSAEFHARQVQYNITMVERATDIERQKQYARKCVYHAVKAGLLPFSVSCSGCGMKGIIKHGEIEYHHDNHLKPLDVRPLCVKCHAREDSILGNKKTPRKDSPKGMSWCSRCEKYLPLDSFWKDAQTYNGVVLKCKECSKKK